jgi:hypothetical protein
VFNEAHNKETIMSKFVVMGVVVVAVVAAWSLTGAADAGVRVQLSEVPPPAVKAVKERFPKAEIRFVDKEGKDRYEFALKEGDRLFDVGVQADGKILNVKEELEPAKVPAPVKEGVQKKFPGARILEAEKITVGDGKEAKVTYDLLLMTEKGKQSAEFDSTGKYVGEGN